MARGKLRLYTFAISHFSEKARWGLDYAGISFDEKRLLPGLHVMTTKRLANGSSVPVLVDGKTTVQGSSAILDYAAESLGASVLEHPAAHRDLSAELEELFDHAFGLGVQRIAYEALLDDRSTTTKLWSQGNAMKGKIFYALAYPGVSKAVRRGYVKGPDAVGRAKERFLTAIARSNALLADNPYLLGDTPTRIDLVFAALLAPMCRPPEHSVAWPETRARDSAFVAEVEQSPSWHHVLKMYRQHRRRASGHRRGGAPPSQQRP